jgi:glycolate oxidase iron-sulfur subunit
VSCCGAVTYHLNKQTESLVFIKQNIDAWWPLIEKGAEAIVITASGCGTMVKEYGHLLEDDPVYATKAKAISEMTKDLCEVFTDELTTLKAKVLEPIKRKQTDKCRVAFHAPCSLQHGQQIKGTVENLLTNAGYTLTTIEDSHLCCGSAGTYSLLQPDLSEQLLNRKIENIEREHPKYIVTANIGCLTQLQSGTKTRVLHWAELLEEALN